VPREGNVSAEATRAYGTLEADDAERVKLRPYVQYMRTSLLHNGPVSIATGRRRRCGKCALGGRVEKLFRTRGKKEEYAKPQQRHVNCVV